jgi:hypothetical protein
MFLPRTKRIFTRITLRAAVVLLAVTAVTYAQKPPSITQPLSPTALNVFNFGPHSFKVMYPAGTSFSGIEMTVTAVPLSQSEFSQLVAGTQFANASCDVYLGEAGNCIDYQVTCSNAEQQPVACPSETTASIAVLTSFNSNQAIVNPGLFTAPIGTDSWTNILDAYYFMRIDPTAHGHTKGFSQFVAVALGATDAQGLGKFSFNAPLRKDDPRSFPAGIGIPVSFSLISATHPGEPVTDATAGLTVLMVLNGKGQAVSEPVFAEQNPFKYSDGNYEFTLPRNFAPGGYILTVYGNAFATQSTSFTIQ